MFNLVDNRRKKCTYSIYIIYRFYVASRFALPAQTTFSPFYHTCSAVHV